MFKAIKEALPTELSVEGFVSDFEKGIILLVYEKTNNLYVSTKKYIY